MNALTRKFPDMCTMLAPEATIEQVQVVVTYGMCAFGICVVCAFVSGACLLL